MEPQQDHNTAHWFDEHEMVDPDFPSGKAIGTRADANGCVFLCAGQESAFFKLLLSKKEWARSR